MQEWGTGEDCGRLEEESAGNHERVTRESGRRTLGNRDGALAKTWRLKRLQYCGSKRKQRIKMCAQNKCAFSGSYRLVDSKALSYFVFFRCF